MAEGTQGNAREPSSGRATPRPGNKREIKILMLHGYTQSGTLFHAKTRAVEKMLQKALAPANLSPQLIYPTGPNRLRPADIPGYAPPAPPAENAGAAADDGPLGDAWAWYRKDDATGTYRFLREGVQRLAEVMQAEGGAIDGVIGFSQGGAMAAMLAAMLEPGRTPPSSSSSDYDDDDDDDDDDDLSAAVAALRAANGHRPLRFAVSYSGFFAPPADLAWLYDPPVATPTLHYLGSLDTVVDESRSRGLVERCADPVVVVHPGGHYVPVSREWVAPLIGFVNKCCAEEGGKL